MRTLFWALGYFETFSVYVALLRGRMKGSRGLLRTRDGISLVCRNNHWDVRIVTETFFDKVYGVAKFNIDLTEQPVVVDVGSYIGDFSLYAAKYLGAKVIAYEPMPDNFDLLVENKRLNTWADLTVWNRAIGTGSQIRINVKREGSDLHASGYMYSDTSEWISVPASQLDGLFDENQIQRIDLLKIDCEGGEYDILLTANAKTFSQIGNIVFEYHDISGWENKLDAVQTRLESLGYSVYRNHTLSIIAASRPASET